MSKFFKVISIIMVLSLLVIVSGCSNNQEVSKDDDGLYVVTSISILSDITKEILGERGYVDYIVPRGEEPEEYEFIPSDFQKTNYADLIIFNGYNLEPAMERAVKATSNKEIIFATNGITPIFLEGDSDLEDPHAWFNPILVATYVENILDALITKDPEGEKYYQENANNYTEKLIDLDLWIKDKVNNIPEENRVLVISENALKYFGEAYGFEAVGIWELNSHEEGTPQQISRVVNIVNDRNLPAIFVESTIDNRYMQTISNETGVPIAGEIFTDALGNKGSGADNYIDMMKTNVNTFVKGLK
ncbi:Manganese ABC transporter, periplasmic-binding protein SitA [Candidatus Syntrophocurvum alkaliphilum]|uniref:Manganese ABC transporter, periplasmic-binding protein SitA n=1 Tax=Candidatus Syntrophocurvum alkaliphilum TaxID=2293317 RepID=A0A6I6DGC9_9FIRM|nr:zinc ABC transporter substrate-binding protein [Candidatus Syntrophocurvum alkaliphilum]QGT99403.1 Manganese ABC transporter, periplasmic-binding protein SitA [Candidatus Syntrophocurvum alkaliphilum]